MQITHLAISLFAGIVTASPFAVEERQIFGSCSPFDPVVIAFQLPIVSNPAKLWCSDLLRTSITTTFTTTPVVVATATATATDFVTATTTNVAVVTTTNTATLTVTTAPATYPLKRDIPTVPLPGPLAGFATSKLSSVCSCFITASTVRVTATATAPARTTTTAVTARTTQSVTVTQSVTTTTTSVSEATETVCVPTTGNTLQNGGFETGTLSPWIANSTDRSSYLIDDEGYQSSAAFRCQLIPNPDGLTIVSITQSVVLCPSVEYTLQFAFRYIQSTGTSCRLQVVVSFPGTTEPSITLRNIPVGNIGWTLLGSSFEPVAPNAQLQMMYVCVGAQTSAAGFFDSISLQAVGGS